MMRRLFPILLVLAVLPLGGGCNGIFSKPQTPAQTLAQADGIFQAAQVAAIAYAKRPRCTEPPTVVTCSKQSIVDLNLKAARSGDITLDAGWATVRTPGADASAIDYAVAAALNAAQAFQKINAEWSKE